MIGSLASARWLACVAAATWASAACANISPICSLQNGDAEFGLYDDYTPYRHGKDLVEFTTTIAASGGRDQVTVLQHCPSGRQLIVIVKGYDPNRVLAEAARQLYSDMIYDTAPFTLEQMRDALDDIGADATVSEFSQQSCACATFGLGRE